jgi:Zn-dependent protease
MSKLRRTLLMTIFGIPLKFSWSAWFLVALASWYGYVNLRFLGVEGTVHLVSGVVLVAVGLIFSIIFHEATHALVARRYGISTTQIAIWGLGGTAFLKGKFARPGQMFWVSIAGPISSLVLAGLMFLAVTIGDQFSLRTGAPGVYWGLIYLLFSNIILAVFNMIPALPLDGGGVLQSLLWKINGNQYRAGLWAASVGMVLAIIGGVFALLIWRDIFLAVLAGFVYFTASAEAKYFRAVLAGEVDPE